MELLSNGFRTRITEIFRPISDCVVLATIPTRRSSPIVESIRNNSEAKVWTVSCSNFCMNKGNLSNSEILSILS